MPTGALRRRWDGLGQEIDERSRTLEGCRVTASHDGASDLARESLLAEVPQNVLQGALVIFVQHVGGCSALLLVHAHVQRRVDAVGEPTVQVVHLQRGDSEVEQDGS